ncbi:MAG TPA: DUF4340 domain-containing protein [Steroidobacteraceae bacterium]|nr:DUF4340 domain-containing protein [Steroidobacteraceae bacterium]
MSARRVIILLISSVVIVILAVWLSSNRPTARATLAGQPVLQGLDKRAVNSVTEIRLAKGDGTKATLKKGNTDWSVGERDYPADTGKVRKLLLDLATLNVVEEKTSTPENYPALGVEDITSDKATGTRVDAVTSWKTYSLIVGKSSGAKSGYARVVSAPQSLLVAPLIGVDADPRRWLEHTLIDIPQDRIKEMAVKPADGPGYTATRTSKDQSDFTVAEVPKGRKLSNPTAADPIAGSLASVSLDDVQHATLAPATGVAHTVFTTFDGLKLDVAGRKEGTRTMISITPTSTAQATEAEAKALDARLKGWEFEIPSYKYDGMFRSLEDLLEKPPEPAAKGGKKPPAAGATPPGGPQGLPPGLTLPGPGK